MRKYLLLVFCFLGLGLYSQTTLVTWNYPNATDNNIADGGIAANTTKTLTTVGATGTHDFTVGGNGSQCDEQTGWNGGNGTKYWVMDFVSTGYSGMTLAFDMRARDNGSSPADWKVQYSLNGSTWVDVPYTLSLGNTNWNSFSTTLPSACDNQAQVYIRWIMTSNLTPNGSTVASGGRFRMDNVIVTAPAPPSCSTYNTPSSVCAAGTNLTWNAATGSPTGYKMYFGTDNPPTNIVNGTNLGNVLTYSTGALTSGATYYWKVVPTNGAGDASGCSVQNFTVSTAPSNDDPCSATAVSITTASNYTTYTNACATTTTAGSPPAPGCASYSGGDVWFTVVVPASGALTFDTQAGVMTDGGMAVYSGTCGALTLIACDDNTGAGNMPQLSLTGQTPGATLWIRIWEFGNDNNGTFGLCVSTVCPLLPTNDACSAATALTLGTQAYGFINTCTGSTGEPAAASCWTTGALNTVWYSVVCPASGNITVRCSPGTLLRTQIALYSGPCGGAMTELFCNDNGTACGGTTPSISQIVATGLTSGTTYYIRVDGENSLVGTFSLIAINGSSTIPDLPGQDCGAPTPVCNVTMSIADPGYQGFGNKCDFVDDASFCLNSSERGSHWLQVNISGVSGGTALRFSIVPNDYSSTTCAQTDYDFAVWKIAGTGATSCSGIATNPNTGLSVCNYSAYGVCGVATGGNVPATYSACSVNTAWEPDITVAAGDVYLILVQNFATSTSGYTIDFSTSTCTIDYGTSATALTWNGSSSTSFTTSTNWGSCTSPSCTVDVTIPSTAPNMPVLTADANVKNITINSGAFFTINPGVTLTVCGNLVNNGTIYCYPNSTIQFTHASASHNMTGNLSGTSALGNLIVNKAGGSVTLNNAMDLQGSFTTSNGTSIFNSNNQNIKIAGNFSNNNGSTTFTNTTSSVIEFNGTSAQTYNQGSSTLSLNSVTINNASSTGVTLNSPMSAGGTLTMTSGLLNTTATNLLTLRNGAASSVGSATSTSYVNGPMAIQKSTAGSSVLNFPVGKSPDCRPVALTVNHANTTLYNYTTESFNASAQNLNWVKPATIDTVSGVHYWDITRTNGAGTNVPSTDLSGNQTVELYFGTNDFVYSGSRTTVVKNTSTAATTWVDIGGTGGPATSGTPVGGSVTSTSSPTAFTSFSRFTLGSKLTGLNPLPVELLNFSGEVVDNGNMLFWQTASELNNNYFDLERSADGVNFYKISQIAGSGTTNNTVSYYFLDKEPLVGLSYYRLKQVDFNGDFEYSNVITITKESDKVLVSSPIPNPAINNVRYDIVTPKMGTLLIQVLDINGKVVLNSLVGLDEGASKINVNTDVLAVGVYSIKVSFNDQLIQVNKLVKQ